MTEPELIYLLDNNKEEGLKKCYALYSKRVFNIALRILNDTQQAEEVTQDVFLKVYDSFSSFSLKSKLGTWEYRIAVNKSIDRQRQKTVRKTLTKSLNFSLPVMVK